MEVYQDDRIVLCTTFDAPDSKGPAHFWQRAGEAPFASDKDVDKVKPNADNPLRATIAGAVRIQILHVERIMTGASLTNLTLIRNTPEDNLWYLPGDEVKRARRAAGL